MKIVVALICQSAFLVVSQAQFVYPDEFELMKQKEERRPLSIPTFPPTLQSINDVESVPYPGFSQSVPVASIPPQEAKFAPANGPPANISPFDSILPPRWRDHVIDLISKGVTKFTLDMDRAIESSNPTSTDNLLFSPVSLTVTLAMVLLASGGKTFEEVARILGLESGVDISNHSEIVHQIFGLLIQGSDRARLLDTTAPQCKFAFGIFVEDGYPVREQFRAISQKVYKSEVISVDFSHRSREAQAVINNWVSDKTNGKIKNMLNEPPNPSTDVIITSALYFSGEWQQHFMEGSTKRKPFTIESNETVYVDMMYNGGEFPFYEDKELGLKIVGFPYKGSEVTMYAILPTVPGAAALKELKSRLKPDVIDTLIANMKTRTCIIGYPKMKLSSTLRLQAALEALGLSSLFNPRTADLSVLSPGRSGHETLETSHTTRAANSGQPSKFTGGFRQSTQSLNPGTRFPSRLNDGRSNYYRYEDKTHGYTVEQWNNGYSMKQNKRARRQSRPIDQEFVEYLNSQKIPNYGIDELRNTAGIHNPGLYADDVIHKVEMTVNEKGTEAAAATSVILDRTGDYKRFLANRPFITFIRHNPVKVIWFWGTINRPTPFYNSP